MGDDREAILRRRRRFIATTLTALAGTAVTATACPCLKVAGPEPPSTDSGGPDSGSGQPSSGGSDGKDTSGSADSDGGPDSSSDEPTAGSHLDDGDSVEEATPGV